LRQGSSDVDPLDRGGTDGEPGGPVGTGADVLISYLDELSDARETVRVVEEAGRRAITVSGDIGGEVVGVTGGKPLV